MAFKDFSDVQYVKTVDTGELIPMGSFSTVDNGELQYVRITTYWEGKTPTTEKVRLNIYSDSDYSSLLYQSEWSNLTEVENKSTNWIGWIRCDFDRENINKNLTYYVEAEFSGYTRVIDTSYISLSYDFPFPVYDNSEDLFFNHPLQMSIFYYLSRTT